MRRKQSLPVAVVLVGAFLLILGGCITQASAPTRFYMLSPIPGPKTELKVAEGDQFIIVGIGPIEFPAYLDRPQFIIRQSQNEFKLAEFDHWAEPLKNNFERVFIENINKLLIEEPVAVAPWRSNLQIDYQLQVEVVRLESDLEGHVSLKAGWILLRDEDKKMILAKVSSYREKSKSKDYKEIVASQSRAVGSLSKEVAETIKGLAR